MIEVLSQHKPQTPSGSRFVIDSCAFAPGKVVEYAVMGIDEGRLYDWPMVYILANDERPTPGRPPASSAV